MIYLIYILEFIIKLHYIKGEYLMDKRDFNLNERTGRYSANLRGFQIEIEASDFADEKIAFSEKVIEAYPSKLPELALFCKESECFQMWYPEETVEDIMSKLHLPIFRVVDEGGRFTYCYHELDWDHIIDIDFEGILETFLEVNIDG